MAASCFYLKIADPIRKKLIGSLNRIIRNSWYTKTIRMSFARSKIHLPHRQSSINLLRGQIINYPKTSQIGETHIWIRHRHCSNKREIECTSRWPIASIFKNRVNHNGTRGIIQESYEERTFIGELSVLVLSKKLALIANRAYMSDLYLKKIIR